jgi:hypothetical protein
MNLSNSDQAMNEKRLVIE